MKISHLSEGLQILAKYAGEQQFCVAAEHDELWVGDDTWPLTDTEKVRMGELGFRAESGMGWHAFV